MNINTFIILFSCLIITFFLVFLCIKKYLIRSLNRTTASSHYEFMGGEQAPMSTNESANVIFNNIKNHQEKLPQSCMVGPDGDIAHFGN